MSWQPILEGELAERARGAVDAVAADLRQPVPLEGGDEGPEAMNPGVAGGEAGWAVFFAYLATEDEGAAEENADQANVYLDRSIDALATTPLGPGLYSGFSGVAWAVEHLSGRLFESDGDATEDIAEALVTMLDRPSWEGDYDLIAGLAGFGVFALEALPQPAARRCLELVVEHFERLAREEPDGLSWYSPAHLLPPHQLEICPDGYFNLGTAHGVPAVLEILARSAASGVNAATAETLLEKGVDWLLAQEMPATAESRFGTWLAEGLEPTPSRLAWCYGDLGLAVSLYSAARTVGREDWSERALEVARHSATRPPVSAKVNDAGLCHGAAGNGHLFNRLFQATGETAFLEAARYWLGRALELRHPTAVAGGFYSYESEIPGQQDSKMIERPDRAWLTGSAGIGLAFLAALSEVEPEWDRLLMADIS